VGTMVPADWKHACLHWPPVWNLASEAVTPRAAAARSRRRRGEGKERDGERGDTKEETRATVAYCPPRITAPPRDALMRSQRSSAALVVLQPSNPEP
jgi:hypothetical protein